MTPETFSRIRDVIYHKLGLRFEDQKIYFLEKRIEKRMAYLNLDSEEAYAFFLRHSDPKDVEMQALANLITTNETYMFREFEQLQAFSDYCLPDVISRKVKAGDRTLNIWSAGCSSGEEAYTLAIILREVIHDFSRWKITITGSDIDQERLQMAQTAVYDDRAVKEVPAEYFDRHIYRDRKDYRIAPETKEMVDFIHLNLNDRLAMRRMTNYDFVFCRNVLIYFDDESRRSAVEHFYHALNKGGYIFLGHSDSIRRITNAFLLRRVGGHLVYYKE